MAKLTLSVPSAAVDNAKQRGMSVSSMVETYLRFISETAEPDDDPALLKRLRRCWQYLRVGRTGDTPAERKPVGWSCYKLGQTR